MLRLNTAINEPTTPIAVEVFHDLSAGQIPGRYVEGPAWWRFGAHLRQK